MRKKLLNFALLGTLTLGSIVMMTSCQPEGNVIPDDLTVTWSGLDTVTLSMGDATPDRLSGVTATASDGTTLEVRVDEDNSMTIDTGYPGTYIVYYYAYDANGNEVDPEDTGYASKTFVVERGVTLDNSTFDESIFGWTGNGNQGSAMSYGWDSTEKALKIDITNSGEEYWQNQVQYNGLDLDAKTTYIISFKAKASTPRNIGASLEDLNNNYAVIDGPNSVGIPLTTEYKTYEFIYTTGADEEYNNVKLGFLMGRFTEADDAPSSIWLDDVYVRKAEKLANSTGVEFSGKQYVTIDSIDDLATLEPVTATDSEGNDITEELVRTGSLPTSFPSSADTACFGEQYTYTDSEGNISYFRRQIAWEYTIVLEEDWEVANGDFDEGLLGWTAEENGLVTINDNEDGTVTIKSVGEEGSSDNNDWRAQLQQNDAGNKLTAGYSYQMEVRAKIKTSDPSTLRTLRLEFCAGAGNSSAKTDLIFEENDTYVTFTSATFTPNADVSGANYRVGLLVGEFHQAYELTVDYIHVNRVENEESAVNASFENGLISWNTEGVDEDGTQLVTFTDNEDGTVTIKSIGESGASDNNDWRSQLYQSNAGNKLTAGKSYQMVVRAKINTTDPTKLTTLRMEFCANAGGNANAKTDMIFESNDTYVTFKSATYTPTSDITGGNLRIGLLVGEFHQAYELTVDYITIIEVTE